MCLFPRYHIYTLSTELCRQAMQVCRLIMRAADQRAEQARWLGQLVVAIDDLKLSVQLTKELQAFIELQEIPGHRGARGGRGQAERGVA